MFKRIDPLLLIPIAFVVVGVASWMLFRDVSFFSISVVRPPVFATATASTGECVLSDFWTSFRHILDAVEKTRSPGLMQMATACEMMFSASSLKTTASVSQRADRKWRGNRDQTRHSVSAHRLLWLGCLRIAGLFTAAKV